MHASHVSNIYGVCILQICADELFCLFLVVCGWTGTGQHTARLRRSTTDK